MNLLRICGSPVRDIVEHHTPPSASHVCFSLARRFEISHSTPTYTTKLLRRVVLDNVNNTPTIRQVLALCSTAGFRSRTADTTTCGPPPRRGPPWYLFRLGNPVYLSRRRIAWGRILTADWTKASALALFHVRGCCSTVSPTWPS